MLKGVKVFTMLQNERSRSPECATALTVHRFGLNGMTGDRAQNDKDIWCNECLLKSRGGKGLHRR